MKTARRLEVDYVIARRRSVWPGVILLALSLAAASAVLREYGMAQAELAEVRAASAARAAERAPAPPPSRERLDEETRSAAAVLRQLALPWPALLGSLERAAARDVAILQLQPDAEQRVLRVSGEVRHREALFAYLRRLAATDGLAEVHLVSQEVRREDPRHPIQFAVQATIREGR